MPLPPSILHAYQLIVIEEYIRHHDSCTVLGYCHGDASNVDTPIPDFTCTHRAHACIECEQINKIKRSAHI